MKTSVVRAYVETPKGLARTLLDSEGRVYSPKLKKWVSGEAVKIAATVPGIYDSWADVPAVWVGHQPFFK